MSFTADICVVTIEECLDEGKRLSEKNSVGDVQKAAYFFFAGGNFRLAGGALGKAAGLAAGFFRTGGAREDGIKDMLENSRIQAVLLNNTRLASNLRRLILGPFSELPFEIARPEFGRGGIEPFEDALRLYLSAFVKTNGLKGKKAGALHDFVMGKALIWAEVHELLFRK